MIEPSIRARLDHHVIAALAKLYRSLAGGLFEVMPTWVRGFSGVQLPAFNIFFPTSPESLTDETLADTAAFFSSREVVYSIELVHDCIPHGPAYLTERRYQPLPPQPAMFLQGAPRALPGNEAVHVERISTVPSLTAFCAMLQAVYDFPLPDIIKLFPVNHLKEDVRNHIRHYLAFVEEKPVGAGTIVCLNGAASIWNVCTLDEYRRQGVATTLIQRMLSEAGENDYSLSMLYSTPQAYSLFSKLGFELYAQRQWFLPPDLEYSED